MANVNEVKAKLSEFLEAVAAGEHVVICNRNRPVAELRPIPQARTEPRPIGGRPDFVVPPSFFDPLPDDLMAGFYGELDPRVKPSRVAEDPGPLTRRHRKKRS